MERVVVLVFNLQIHLQRQIMLTVENLETVEKKKGKQNLEISSIDLIHNSIKKKIGLH